MKKCLTQKESKPTLQNFVSFVPSGVLETIQPWVTLDKIILYATTTFTKVHLPTNFILKEIEITKASIYAHISKFTQR